MYLVTENTPGYLPEDFQPAEFESYPEAHEYALEQARAYTEGRGDYEREISSSTRYYITEPPETDQIRVACDDPRTLDRVWEITYRVDDPAHWHNGAFAMPDHPGEAEIIVGCPGCGGYIFEGDALCGNCKLPKRDPKAVLRHHVTGAIERGEATPIVEIPAKPPHKGYDQDWDARHPHPKTWD